MKETFGMIQDWAQRLGYCIVRHNPGDGARYRVFAHPGPANFHEGDGELTAKKLSELTAFLRGVEAERRNTGYRWD